MRSILISSLVVFAVGCDCGGTNPSTDGGAGGGSGGGAVATGGGTGGGSAGGGSAGGGAGGGSACSAATTCSGHGTCSTSGACVCDAAFMGASCSACSADHFGYPACTACTAATTCSGHGTCSATGTCTCDATFGGASCNACAADHYGFPACVACTAATTCNAHGSCSASGTCTCNTGFADAGCDQCAAGFTPYPTCAPPLLQPLASAFLHRGPGAPDMAFTADGGVFVMHTPFNDAVQVSQLVTGQWQALGDPASDAGTSLIARPALVATPAGILVAYGESLILRTRRFDGAQWQQIPFPQAGAMVGTSRPFDLLVDSQGRAVLVMIENREFKTRRLEGGAWVDFGPPLTGSLMNYVRATLRPDDTLVAVGTFEAPPFGTGMLVAQQGVDAGWTVLGTNPVDSIGDTTNQLQGTDVDVTATETYVTWFKGNCNSNTMPRYVARATLPTWSAFGESGALGLDPISTISGAGIVQVSRPACNSPQISVQRWTGTAWNAAIMPTDLMSETELVTVGGTIYLAHWYASSATGNVVRLNVP